MNVRCKMTCFYISPIDPNFPDGAREVRFTAVYAQSSDLQKLSDNTNFWKYTPQGTIQMTIDNPVALAQFEEGKEFYVDFIAAPKFNQAQIDYLKELVVKLDQDPTAPKQTAQHWRDELASVGVIV